MLQNAQAFVFHQSKEHRSHIFQLLSIFLVAKGYSISNHHFFILICLNIKKFHKHILVNCVSVDV